jgi:hypothetical protein
MELPNTGGRADGKRPIVRFRRSPLAALGVGVEAAMTTSSEKGEALEAAVRAIETVILKESPALREDTFIIESRKVISVEGVRHELDLFVTVDHGQDYKAVFIFECKNWSSSPVGKNEMIVFSEKIRAVQAQRGFFVAKSYTGDAEAQAKMNPRITLLTVTEHDPASTPVPLHFHLVGPISADARVEFLKLGSSGRELVPVDSASARLTVSGEETDFDHYLRYWISQACEESTKGFPSGDLPEGEYDRPVSASRKFSRGEVILNDHEIESASLQVMVKLRVTRPPVASHFEVATRGRSISLAPVTIEGVTLSVGFVAK